MEITRIRMVQILGFGKTVLARKIAARKEGSVLVGSEDGRQRHHAHGCRALGRGATAGERKATCKITYASNASARVQAKCTGREPRRLAVVGVLPTTASALTARLCARCLRLEAELCAQRHDPLVLEEFNGAGALVWIAVKALHQEVNALLAKLVAGGELWRISLRNVVHDGPLVVHGSPRAAAGCHFENHAAQGPDIDSAVATGAATLDDFGRHVHRGAGHGTLFAAARGIVHSKGPTLASDELGSAKIHKLDDTIVVEEDVWTTLA